MPSPVLIGREEGARRTREQHARDAAQRLVVSYDADANVDTDPAKTDALEQGDPETAGDFEAAFSKADVTLDRAYSTPPHAAAAMEPHAALAEWEGETLTLRGAQQMLKTNRLELADAVGIDPENVRLALKTRLEPDS